MSQSTFFSLSSRLQHGIAHTLGWSALRPVQEMTIAAVQRGENCVVLAPTAGGKTEAAFFPIIDAIFREQLAPVSALYISPIRALLNNQELRLTQLTGLAGFSAFKWHGDVGQAERRHFLAAPSHVLMTTPESLEVMLISPRIDKQQLFADLRFVVIDEIHSFAADDRGAHLMAVLERLAQYSRHDIQRIGLSATVGNPVRIGEWMCGSSRRSVTVIDPPKSATQRMIRIDAHQDEEELSLSVAPLAAGRKTLFFVEGRRLAEGVVEALAHVTATNYVHHSSVGRELREEAEYSFAYGGANQCIVCTSTMELGIDVGDLDAVLQLDAPSTVSSFMQRMGRTGRRPGSRAEMNFFCGEDLSLLRAIALVNLARRGWIESVQPSTRAYHILAHQILAQSLQFHGVRQERLWQMAQAAFPFANISRVELDSLIQHMLATDILNNAGGLLILGKQGEKRYGRRNFLSLYSVFETPQEIRVLTSDKRVIGTLDAWFVQQLGTDEFVFMLAGRPWQVKHLDLELGEMVVIPAPKGSAPRWGGGGPLLGREVAAEMREVLTADEVYPFATKRAGARLASLRAQWRDLLNQAALPIQHTGQRWVLHTFAGDRINLTLARALSLVLDCGASGDSLSITIKPPAGGISLATIRDTLTQVGSEDFFTAERIADLVRSIPKSSLSKFQPLLPPALEAQFLADRLLDIPGVQSYLAQSS